MQSSLPTTHDVLVSRQSNLAPGNRWMAGAREKFTEPAMMSVRPVYEEVCGYFKTEEQSPSQMQQQQFLAYAVVKKGVYV